MESLLLEYGYALLFLWARRVRRAVRWRERGWADRHPVAPVPVGLMGALNLLSAIWPREPAVMQRMEQRLGPRGEGRHLVYPRGADLLRAAGAPSGLHGAGGLRRLVLGS